MRERGRGEGATFYGKNVARGIGPMPATRATPSARAGSHLLLRAPAPVCATIVSPLERCVIHLTPHFDSGGL